MAKASRRARPGVPAHLSKFVEVLGSRCAVELFLALGGSQIYLPRRSSEGALVAKTIGVEQANRLAAVVGDGYIKVPLARQWVAQALRAEGKSDNEIARVVRADIATVRRWLGPRPSTDQLNLPL
jgi:hypothetical protein